MQHRHNAAPMECEVPAERRARGMRGVSLPYVFFAATGTGGTETTTLHRIDEQFLIKDVERAGFRLYGASSALRNPKDDRTWLVFKHRGETDRFMLKFVKAPAIATGASGSGSGQ